jgi:DNA repair exonuclease SbcCD ATPase subunit
MATGLFLLLLSGAVEAHAVQLSKAKADVTPVEKVIAMVNELQAKVSQEGAAEAATYDKFACFCKSKTDEKTKSIAAGEQAVSDAVTEINTLSAKRDSLDEDIQTTTENIETYQEQLKTATEMRAKEKATFEAALADMEASIAQIHGGIESLKNSAFLQGSSRASALSGVNNLIKTALDMAEAMNIVPKKTLSLLSQKQPVEDYTFKAGPIIETLEGLWKEFREKKVELETSEQKAESDFNIAVQSKKHQIEQATAALADLNKKRSETTEAIATANEDLTAANALLNDDRVYLKDLTTTCETKAKEWDQRSTMRADELAALTQALTVLSGTVADKAAATGAGGRGRGLVQEEEEVSFVQTAAEPRRLRLVKEKTSDRDLLRDRLVSMLKRAGEKTKSAALVTLAAQVTDGPFDKIKGMIQEMIEKLLQEEADEANHKGTCDKELAKTLKDRDYRLRDVEALHTSIESNSARREKLGEEISTLQGEITTLQDDLSAQTTSRAEEKAENEVTVREAKEGVEAVKQAIDILSHFYGEAAQATVELQTSQPDDIPDSGFDGAYTGSQGASTGILGMMEVIQGDFERTISSTEEAELAQKTEFVDYERETKMSLSTKQSGLDHATTEHTETVDKLSTDMEDFITQSELLDAAVKTWENLIPGCVADPGMSYEERVARREAEVVALKDAYCILDNKEAGCDGVF